MGSSGQTCHPLATTFQNDHKKSQFNFNIIFILTLDGCMLIMFTIFNEKLIALKITLCLYTCLYHDILFHECFSNKKLKKKCSCSSYEHKLVGS